MGIFILILLFLIALYLKPLEGFQIEVSPPEQCPSDTHATGYNTTGYSKMLVCEPCPAGHSQSPTNQWECVAKITCLPNQYLSGSTCMACPNGQTSQGGTVTSCMPLSCSPGQILVNGSCVSCPNGQTSQGGTATLCTPLTCDVNFQPSGNVCTECASNQTSPGGSGLCTTLSCPNNLFASKHSCTSCAKGTAQVGSGCAPCLAGSSLSGGKCTQCGTGQYSDTDGSPTCSSCPTGTYTNQQGESACQSCPAGQYQDVQGQSGCKSCPTGMYVSTSGSSACNKCSTGSYQDVSGSNSCINCPVGFYQDLEGKPTCKPCPENTYSDTPGAEKCAPCPQGSQTASTGATSSSQCLTSMTATNCTDAYRASHLSFDDSVDPNGSTLYYGLTTDNFSLTTNSMMGENSTKDDNISKCVLNKRLQNRSSICKQNSGASKSPYNSSSLLQAFEYTNSKGICVDKKGNAIPYPTTLPPRTIGSSDSVLAHITGCTNTNDAKTCTYQYLNNGVIQAQNPCVIVDKIYDFDIDLCVDPSSASSSGCENYQVYDHVTGKCHDVTNPVNKMPPRTRGLLKSSDYRDCVTTNKGDCTVVYRMNTAQSAGDAAVDNICPPPSLPSYTVYDFDKNACVAPSKGYKKTISKSGFNDYQLQKPIIR